MKNSAQKKKKTKENTDLKNALCDIINKLNNFSATDKKLEELANYCTGAKRVGSETSR